MNINIISPVDLPSLIDDHARFLERLESEVFIVRSYFSDEYLDSLREFCEAFSKKSESAWNRCDDDCPDYHRIHDNYPGAYVKSRQHAYYFHPWNEHRGLLDEFSDIFEIKTRLSGRKHGFDYYKSHIPSDGVIARLLMHQYPRGGGGQELHVDPVSELAKVQTIIQASSPGIDYQSGGFYLVHEKFGSVNLDALTKKGDLLLVSPGVKHGVSPIDPESDLDWESRDGRWILMPIFIHSDVYDGEHEKPKQVRSDG
jgi:hypothetical protein